jgi:hypothetical protein
MSEMNMEILTKRIEVLEKQVIALLDEKNINNKKSNPSKVKRVSGYIMHNSARREEIKNRLEADNDKVKPTDITKELASVWKALSDEERKMWNDKAKEANESDSELEKEIVKEDKPKKKKSDKPKVKRVSGYILFQKAMRDEAVQTLEESRTDDSVKIKQSQVMSELGKMWKSLDDDEKKEWNNKAAELKDSDNED